MTDSRIEKEAALARRAAPNFGLSRQQSVIWGARQRLRSGGSHTRRAVAMALAACIALSLAAYLGLRPSAEGSVATQAPRDERWQLRDGSRILIETPDTRITKQRESSNEVVFELASGAAEFDVARRPERAFRVLAGAVRVEVIGTKFRVERRAERSEVSVQRGRVRVAWGTSSQELSAGQSGVFPPDEARVEPTSTAAMSVAPTSAPPIPAAPSAEALFAAADRARSEGHSAEAVKALRQLTQRFPHDARAPLAAFTLGRLLLESLHQPAEAARVFAQARALSGGNGALAEDALAREVEAWRAAGNSGEAAKRAEQYRTLYPHSARLKQVLRAAELPTEP